ncbi:MAG: Aluminum resistance protein [Firmicutes bacterium]|nr:Aluminum resistance protein [Bacillota bacterium]
MEMPVKLMDLLKLDKKLVSLDRLAVRDIREQFERIDDIRLFNQAKVLRAMQEERLSDSHFAGTTGYGYGDSGRDVIDGIYARVFGGEDALVRVQMVSGTHALATCLRGLLRPGDELLSVTGRPYDTLEEVLGIRGSAPGNLREFGIGYSQVDLKDGSVDYEGIRRKISDNSKVVFLQRSTGYDWRPALSIRDVKSIVNCVRELKKDAVIMVDNCYGEFIEKLEPLQVGADIIAGSLIKNPGGGLAPAGGYIAGKRELVERCASALTAPGLGKKCGASLGMNRSILQGLFLAPHIVAEALKGAIYASRIFEILGFRVSPGYGEKRSDIIQSVEFENKEQLLSFCRGIQKGAPVDSFVTPYPWDMPGYGHQVVMAAGAFVQGSSIELSADAPIREPYYGYLQGGLTWDHTRLGVLMTLQQMKDEGHIIISGQ